MNKAEVRAHLEHSISWGDPDNAEAATVFYTRMRRKQYGFDACSAAWAWFVDGWKASKSAARDALNGNAVSSEEKL